jgi:polyhydroxybutyrate depolymerase
MLRRARSLSPLLVILLLSFACSSNPSTPAGTGAADNSGDDGDDSNTDSSGSSARKDAGASNGKPADAGKKPTADSATPKPNDDGDPPAQSKDSGTPGTSTPDKSDAGQSTSTGDAGGGPSASAPQDCSTKKNTWKAGDTNLDITVGGTKRTFIMHVPTLYKGDKPVPLVLDWHPMIFGTAANERSGSGYAELADKENFIVAYADGIDAAWNMGPCCTKSRDVDDYGLALALIERFKTEGCIDEKRVYSVGYSNGGGLTHYLGCKYADVFAAISPAAFDLITEVPCEPSRPISVIDFRGTSDPIVPYAGGESTPPTSYPLDPIHFLGAVGTFKKWAEVDGCTGEPTDAGGGCQTYSQCKGSAQVTLCTAQGGSHVTGDAKVAWPFLKKFSLP